MHSIFFFFFLKKYEKKQDFKKCDNSREEELWITKIVCFKCCRNRRLKEKTNQLVCINKFWKERVKNVVCYKAKNFNLFFFF